MPESETKRQRVESRSENNILFVFIYTIVRFCLRIFMCKTDRLADGAKGVCRKREREKNGERARHALWKKCGK